MKKIFTLLSLMGIFTSGFAQWQNGADRGPKYDNRNDNYRSSALVIKAFTEKRFTVMVDNVQYQLNDNNRNTRRDNSIMVGAMAPGRHTVTVYEVGFLG
jgi:putative hemolysin